MITKLDFVGVPSTDAKRSHDFYVKTLGLRSDDKASESEFWVGDTCFTIWEPARQGFEFQPQKLAHLALHVDDVAEAKAELEARESGLTAISSTPASATWPCSGTRTATT